MGVEEPSLKAARDVRLIIQRVRVATPENFEELESELLQALETRLDDLGDKFESVQDSADKGLEIARKRVDGILKKRLEEEAKDQIPKKALEELKELITSFENRTAEFTASTCLEGEATIIEDDLSLIEGVTSNFAQELQMFVKSYADFVTKHMAVIKSPTLAPTIKTEFAQSSAKVDQRKKIAEGLLATAKSKVAKVQADVKKELLEQAKAELKDRLKECVAPLEHATEAVLQAERAVEPFAKAKQASEEEMLALAADVDTATSIAREAIDSAKDSLHPPETAEGNELIKAELNQWLVSEAKKPELRLGQLNRRIARVVQLVRQYRRDVNKVRHKEMLQEILPGFLEQAKAAAENSQTIASVDLAIKNAEQQVQPFLKSVKMSEAEMQELADKAAAALAVAKEEARLAQQALRPIDETLDDDLKKQLNEKVTPVVKKSELRISGMEKRLTRVKILIDRFREDIRKKMAGRVAVVKEAAFKVMALYREAQAFSIEDMFSAFDIRGNGHFDVYQFLSFFEQAEVPDRAELAQEDLKALFALHAKDGIMTQDAYMDFMCAYMKVTKPTALTEGLAVAGCKALRQLKLGELLQVINGPKLDDSTGLSRVQVQPVTGSDLSIGWVTVSSTAGAAFLQPCPAAEVAKARQ